MAMLYQSNIKIAEDQSHLIEPCTTEKPETFLNANEYSRYIMCCMTTIYRDNIFLYKLPKGLKLFHGSENFNKNQTSKPTNNMWFTLNVKDASIYGYVHEYTLLKDLLVVSMDRPSNIEVLMGSAYIHEKPIVLKSIEASFSLVDETETKQLVIRMSEATEDKLIASYLCELGYNGFAAKPLLKSLGGTFFHAEVFICDVSGIVSNGNYSSLNEQFIADISLLKQSLTLKRKRETEKKAGHSKRRQYIKPKSLPFMH